ncbi:WH1 domain-containing protein [Hirsutella rhossiliensis]|uniref:WH1 domain-containing protein n=1 Tax=Hirsutella rhossiliensis TaxID=111463 RepID=A0A9P8MZV6_9HYPO|nr:WH1 domain-containing protein [Hirsutella rhossiliensis]KAH0964330.1 WH1 domain-containing protein [Hirsutella rhossiliensis]
MPSILSDEDKDTVKRFVPKQSNKIQAVAVARLYVAYPNRSKWTYTGVQGAIVIANDLVGNTFWLKMVDISPSGRGVIWDQEIFDTWNYNQDRTFFHTFELEDCLAGLSFVDEKEAKQFKKKMDEREKNASRATRSTPFGAQATQPNHSAHPGHHSSMLAPSTNGSDHPSEFALLDAFDPLWREHFGQDLSDKGLTDDFIKENQEFIVDFLRDEQAKVASQVAPRPPTLSGPPALPPPPPTNGHDSRSACQDADRAREPEPQIRGSLTLRKPAHAASYAQPWPCAAAASLEKQRQPVWACADPSATAAESADRKCPSSAAAIKFTAGSSSAERRRASPSASSSSAIV